MVSYFKTKTKIALSLSIALSIFVTAIVMIPSRQNVEPGPSLSQAYPANTIGIVNGCGPTYVFNPPATMYGVLPDSIKESDSNIPMANSIVKTYGYMSAKGLSDEVLGTIVEDKTPIPLPTILRTLYDGKIVIWYTEATPKKDLDRIERVVSGSKNAVALPWTDTSPLPFNRTFAIASWNISQTCFSWDPQILIDFVNLRNKHVAERSVEPQKAPLKHDGTLYFMR